MQAPMPSSYCGKGVHPGVGRTVRAGKGRCTVSLLCTDAAKILLNQTEVGCIESWIILRAFVSLVTLLNKGGLGCNMVRMHSPLGFQKVAVTVTP